jgi:hypothetical protein
LGITQREITSSGVSTFGLTFLTPAKKLAKDNCVGFLATLVGEPKEDVEAGVELETCFFSDRVLWGIHWLK